MKRILSREVLALCVAGAGLIFAIRFFEMGFLAGQVSSKLYITFIGLVFLGVGAYTALKLWKPRVEATAGKTEAPEVQPADSPLTEREAEILRAIARGLTNRQIAEELFVSENTVKKHINNIYFKLDVNRRTQAVARGKALRILPA